ncbi:MAG: transposase [Desulfoferrobacter sp.]
MPRANRYFVPGYVWHITHRCHKREFLLKFARDRKTWINWLWEAKKRYGLQVLNYTVTSNHIHLLVFSNHDREVIPRSLQLIAGKVAQQFNQRKKRKGAFWQDRYHATAVDRDEHLVRCLMYIDYNMVRAGVVEHPNQWPHSGCHEIVDPPERYQLIDRNKLLQLLNIRDGQTLSETYRSWVNEMSKAEGRKRDENWTKPIAAGSESFVKKIKEKLAGKAVARSTVANENEAIHVLQEVVAAYNINLGHEMGSLTPKNALLWNVYDESSTT